MVYRALTEYLKHRNHRPGAPGWAYWIPPVAFTASMLWEPTRNAACLLSIVTIVLMILIFVRHEVKREDRQAATGVLESETWLRQIASYVGSGQLEERSHPALVADLEACAALRQSILNALEGEEWNRLARNTAWADVRKTCRQTAESLMEDAIWSAKGAMRAPGGRRETFRKRCENPEFASKALGGVRLAREKLATLLDEVHEEPFAAQGVRDPLARAQTEMQAIRDAEAEIREFVGGVFAEELDSD